MITDYVKSQIPLIQAYNGYMSKANVYNRAPPIHWFADIIAGIGIISIYVLQCELILKLFLRLEKMLGLVI